MLPVAMIKCARCGHEVRRKRLVHRYCSARCRNAASKARTRSGRQKAREAKRGRRTTAEAPTYREAGTQSSSGRGKAPPFEQRTSVDVKDLTGPVVNVTGRPLQKELLELIIRTEVGATWNGGAR